MRWITLTFLILFLTSSLSVKAQNGWYSDIALLAGSGRLYQTYEAKLSGNISLTEHYKFKNTPICIGVGAGGAYLQDEKTYSSSFFSITDKHGQVNYEFPISLGFTVGDSSFSFNVDLGIAYFPTLDFQHKTVAFEPKMMLLFNTHKRSAIGVEIKLIQAINKETDAEYSPYFLGGGLVLRYY